MSRRDDPAPPSDRGDEGFERLTPIVYEELRRLAAAYMRDERRAHTLQPTALAHEVYLRLAGDRRVEWTTEAQLLAIAARAMRRILVEHARKRAAHKRGGGRARVTLSDAHLRSEPSEFDVLDLAEQLDALAQRDPRKARIAEMRIFGGLTLAQAAEVSGVSTTTAEDDWYMARAWLRERLRAR